MFADGSGGCVCLLTPLHFKGSMADEDTPQWPPPSEEEAPANWPPPTPKPPQDVTLAETAQNNLIWALLVMLAFISFIIGALVVMELREVEPSDALTTIAAGAVGGAITQIGKIIESVGQLFHLLAQSLRDRFHDDQKTS